MIVVGFGLNKFCYVGFIFVYKNRMFLVDDIVIKVFIIIVYNLSRLFLVLFFILLIFFIRLLDYWVGWVVERMVVSWNVKWYGWKCYDGSFWRRVV